MKLKLGLTYKALAVFFGIHRTTVSKIFTDTQSRAKQFSASRQNFSSEPQLGPAIGKMAPRRKFNALFVKNRKMYVT